MRMNNILLVDDNTSYLHLLSILLESKGFAVTIATNGNSALENLAKSGIVQYLEYSKMQLTMLLVLMVKTCGRGSQLVL